ncbi:MAG: hypothetical protein QOI48_4319 [Solirubrobacteraceae bacterium]|jgi:hypothetical protein|nr:hypothetical protein [Solirubrobacteraceae bacterium]
MDATVTATGIGECVDEFGELALTTDERAVALRRLCGRNLLSRQGRAPVEDLTLAG